MSKFLFRRLPASLQHECPQCHAGTSVQCVTKTGNPAAETHKGRLSQLCDADWSVGTPIEGLGAIQAHLRCAKLKNHAGWHRNAAQNLSWGEPEDEG